MLTPIQQRPATKRAIQNENDENVGVTRLTRAKAAALGASELDVKKKTTLVRSKSVATATTTTNPSQVRKRAALGDVSNFAKQQDLGVDKSAKDAKKPLATKAGLVSKAAQPTRVQKLSRSQSTRSILGPKDKNTVSSELKRPASGSGAGHVSKKRHTGSSSSKVVEEDTLETENAPPALATLTSVSVEVKKSFKTEVVQEDDVKTLVDEPSTTPKDLPADFIELDAEDLDDPLMVAEYVGEIFTYLKELEINTMANHNYIENQPDLEWQMRGILIDWLLEVHTRFRLLPETLFLAVNIIDRFLSSKVVQLDRLQLVGVTAMFIASKYEEVLSPHVTNFRHVADDGFTEDEILSAERFVLAALNYDLSYPNPMNFLRRISKADSYDVQTRTLGKYMLEISCLDHRFLEHPPSQIAAAAMYLSRLVLDRGEWVCSIFLFIQDASN
jgi:G2/mitotic-specific cyclin 1/2